MGHYKPDCPNKEKWTKSNNGGNGNGKNGGNKKHIKAHAATVSWDLPISSAK